MLLITRFYLILFKVEETTHSLTGGSIGEVTMESFNPLQSDGEKKRDENKAEDGNRTDKLQETTNPRDSSKDKKSKDPPRPGSLPVKKNYN